MQNDIHPVTPKSFLTLDYTSDVMFFIVPLLAIVGIFAGNYLYENNIKGLASKNTLREKLSGFQSASIIKYALLEGPALLGIVDFMKDGNQYFLIISLILLAWLIAQRPTRDKVERDLKLEGSLKSEFQQEDKSLE